MKASSESLHKIFNPVICFGKVLADLITNWIENQTLSANWDENELNNDNQNSTLLPLQ